MRIAVAVLYGYGINCQDETLYACRLAGFPEAKKVHLNEFLWGKEKLEDYHFLIFPGGFSGGDQLGAGVFFALRMQRLKDQLQKFIEDGKLILGICNGFQILVNMGLLPGCLTYNDCGNFQDRWVYLKVEKESRCVFTKNLDFLELPIRHGEGKYWAPKEVLSELERKGQITFRYAKKDGSLAEGEFPYNPNGSLLDIAGVTDSTGRILGLMPHPEGFLEWGWHPRWTRVKEKLKREGKKLPRYGQGLQIFKNALVYLKQTF